MNHDRPNSDGCKEYGIAFGEAVLKSSPPSRSQICDSVVCHRLNESGFGGWADEKTKTAREAAPLLSRKKNNPQHLTISLKPKHIIPVHTFFPEKYSELLGSNVKMVKDKETVEI